MHIRGDLAIRGNLKQHHYFTIFLCYNYIRFKKKRRLHLSQFVPLSPNIVLVSKSVNFRNSIKNNPLETDYIIAGTVKSDHITPALGGKAPSKFFVVPIDVLLSVTPSQIDLIGFRFSHTLNFRNDPTLKWHMKVGIL